ncbi:MAG: hypothetical protein L6R38_006617 [Xanthoria sp. 2 TBL-2021]|nr:MAG: hypothetical protein L6R38_006617 [Xanthoria sp. 2 TBL-2021]
MSEAQPIILFDLPGKGHCSSWSPNTWKTRLVLNYKQIPYTTQWIELNHIAPHFKSLGIPPNPPSLNPKPYTVPAIRLPDGTYIMDSKNIAASLEEKYPDPPLHLDSPQLAKVGEIFGRLLMPMRGILIPKIVRNLLNPESVPYFHESRSKQFGMPLEQLDKELGGDAQWEEAKPIIREIAALIEEGGGPFVLGGEVSYADFILVGALCLFKRLGEGVFERTVRMEPALATLYEASGKWLEKNN